MRVEENDEMMKIKMMVIVLKHSEKNEDTLLHEPGDEWVASHGGCYVQETPVALIHQPAYVYNPVKIPLIYWIYAGRYFYLWYYISF